MSAVFICAIAEIGCRGSPTSLKVARRTKTKIGICGQAPSDYSDFAEFLVECGIDSISLNPDTVVKTTLDILKTEERLGK